MQSAPIIVEGIESNGIVIPIITPNSLSAKSFDIPNAHNFKGIIIAINGWSKLPHNLTSVSGKVLLIIFLKYPFLNLNLPLFLKYNINPYKQLIPQAILSEIPTDNIGDFIQPVNGKIIQNAIRNICSTSSTMLTAK